MLDLALQCVGPMHRPVSVAQALTRHGLGLREAHMALNGLAAGKLFAVRMPTGADPAELRRELAELSVAVEPVTVVETMD